jgi:hypothetical protein
MSGVVVTGGKASTAEAEFQEKMKERMRAAMGDLMPNEVLAGIVARGIDEAFFKPNVTKDYYGRDERHPSWLVQFIAKETKDQVAKAVEEWVKSNQYAFSMAVDETLKKGLASAIVSAFDSMLFIAFQTLKDNIAQAVDSLRRS